MAAALLANTIDPAQKCRLVSLCARGANRLLNLDHSRPTSRLDNADFVSALRLNLGLPPSKFLSDCPLATCVCGSLLKDNPTHFEACITFRNTLVTKRHHKVTKALATLAENMGCIVSDGEFVLPSGKRTDLTLRLATDPRAMQIDTSIVQPSCDTYCRSRAQSKPLHAALHREEVKRKKYEAEVTAIGDTFCPFVWESYGAPAPSVISTVELIRSTGQIRGLDPPSTKECLDDLYVAMVRGNSNIYSSGLSQAKLNKPSR